MADNKRDTNELQQVDEALKSLDKDSKASGEEGTHKNSIMFYILSIVAALLLVALIIGGVFFFAIKNNVNGVAENMRGTIENIPVLKLALPPLPEPEDEKNMTEEQVRQKYTELRAINSQLEKQLEELTKQSDAISRQLEAKDTNSTLLQQQKDEAEKAQQKQAAEYETLKKDFDELTEVIAKGDPTAYKEYFERIDAAKAAELYEKVMQKQKISADAKKYVSIYESMDAASVATILEQLGKSKMPLILEILQNMKKETAAGILTEMAPEFAAQVSEQLAKVYNVGTDKTEK
ncbi:hypothetical protein CLHUN_15820 [Ruminiclostridium hungatei]|uniref:Magnesium transporter MgtE intracellular domain-containing protein n=1 Tax=Ruminiclostridium hungatei TaxID=48256 RepID=A0A1V4SL16_RUMHU|nr:hypothetical protein [Ruminiclostridium hungatei]OPX44588.1 hypothetical protein CLHUN_15820 [Ruminiclostridium hungatei]